MPEATAEGESEKIPVNKQPEEAARQDGEEEERIEEARGSRGRGRGRGRGGRGGRGRRGGRTGDSAPKPEEEGKAAAGEKKEMKPNKRGGGGGGSAGSEREKNSERPSRERKAVVRFAPMSPAKVVVKKSITVQEGSGTKLKHIPNVSFKLSKRKADENLQALHSIIYGKKANIRLVKMNISKFSGFVWAENEEKQRTRVREKLDKCNKDRLLDFCDVLDIPEVKVTTKKEEILARLLQFLESPSVTRDFVITEEKKGKTRKRRKDASSADDNKQGLEPDTGGQDQNNDSRSGDDVKDGEDTSDREKPESSDNDSDAQDDDTHVKTKTKDDEEDEGEDLDDEDTAPEPTKPQKTSTAGHSKSGSKKAKVAAASKAPVEGRKVSTKVVAESPVEPKAKARGRPRQSPAKKSAPVDDKDSAKNSSPVDDKDSSGIPSKRKREPRKTAANDKDASAGEKKTTKRNKTSSPVDDKDSSGIPSKRKREARKTAANDKDASAGEKKTTKRNKTKGKGKAGRRPTNEEIHAVVSEILLEVDFNTATLADIIKQLGEHFKVDLMDRKAEVKAIIADVINNMPGEDDDEDDEEDDGEQSEGERTKDESGGA